MGTFNSYSYARPCEDRVWVIGVVSRSVRATGLDGSIA